VRERDEKGRIKRNQLDADSVARIAAFLDECIETTVPGACLKAGVPQAYNSLKQAMWRIAHDKATDEEVEFLAPILLAKQLQCEKIVKAGWYAAASGGRTGYYEWLASNRDRSEYGKQQQIALTNADGSDLSSKSPRELLEMLGELDKVAKEEA
jgi:hypothetical protein